jgi:outer membrane protein OmpA-like peptidoglycan-associated protein
MNDPKEPADEQLDVMLSRLASLANNPTPEKVASSAKRSRAGLFAGIGALVVAAIGVGIWQIKPAADPDNNTASSPTDSVSTDASVSPASTAVITLTTEPAAPVSVASEDSPSTDVAVTTTLAPTTTVSASTTVPVSTTVASPTSAAPTAVLTGVPSANLPGGQPWPNGLYQDDILYIRGTLPSAEVSSALEARVVAILGRANVVNEVVVDPTVPMVETVLLRLGNSVLFKSGDFDVPPESEPGFQLWALFLGANPDVKLTIIGYTDNVGSEDYNIELATKRAHVARDYIGRTDPSVLDRVEVVGLGPADPLGSNDTSEGRQLNRRVEFAVTGLFAKP